jgi:alginate O-acetyltransferase complex protein AlgI
MPFERASRRFGPEAAGAGLRPLMLILATCGVGAIVAETSRHVAPAWAIMWAEAVLVFFVFKCITWRPGLTARAHDRIGYLLAWVGMDPEAFLRRVLRPDRFARQRAIRAALNLLIGSMLIVAIAPAFARNDLFTGAWIAMIGFIVANHCGLLALLALGWRAAGRDVKPIMDRPLAARSVGDFWSGRWNSAFTDAMRRCVLVPVARRWNATAGLLAVFLVSGLLHELLISVPADAGYGIPTAYFALQACAIGFERSRRGRRLLSTPAVRRAFAWLIVAGPAVWLFSPWFVARVVLPFMTAIGTL